MLLEVTFMLLEVTCVIFETSLINVLSKMGNLYHL
jgi:hypothetical protein